MKTSTWNRAEGKLREVEGALKEAVGAAARNRNLDVEGKYEKRVGKIQGAMAPMKKGRREINAALSAPAEEGKGR